MRHLQKHKGPQCSSSEQCGEGSNEGGHARARSGAGGSQECSGQRQPSKETKQALGPEAGREGRGHKGQERNSAKPQERQPPCSLNTLPLGPPLNTLPLGPPAIKFQIMQDPARVLLDFILCYRNDLFRSCI